jgi:cell division initiation protein
MAITAMDIQQQSFGTARHGYEPQEVDVFLERLAAEVDTFNRALVEARSRYEAAETRAQAAEQQLQQAQAANRQASQVRSSAATEEQISRAFIAAQRSADALTEEAREKAEAAYREAETRARDIVRDALAEKQRILNEVDRLRASCEKFRSDYLSLLKHFSADAQKTMPSIEDFTPDTSKEELDSKAKTLLSDNDASVYPAARSDAQPQAAAFGAAASSFASSAPAAASGDAAGFASAQTSSPAPSTQQPQGEGDFLDDLDIEEID